MNCAQLSSCSEYTNVTVFVDRKVCVCVGVGANNRRIPSTADILGMTSSNDLVICFAFGDLLLI